MMFLEHFQRISVINLPERTDRRSEMEWELQRAGLKTDLIEFFPAIKMKEAAGFPNAGYHGCFRSHLEVLRQAAQANAANVVVFEDDASLSDRFKIDEQRLVEQLRSFEWGLAYFGHGIEDVDDRPTEWCPCPQGAPLAHFYAVNGQTLPRLVAFLDQILQRPAGHPDGGPMSPDGALHVFLAQNPDVPCYATSPSLARQRSSRSDLLPRWFDKLPGLRETASTYRRVKRWLLQK